MNIEIRSKALKDKIVEINTTLKFEDRIVKKSFFEITLNNWGRNKNKQDLEKIVQAKNLSRFRKIILRFTYYLVIQE